MVYIWKAPTRLSGSALPALGAVAGGTAVLMLVDQPIYSWTQSHPRALPVRIITPLREGHALNLLGRSYVLAAGSALLYTAGWAADSHDLREAGMGCISAAFSASLSRSVFNSVIGRMRPRFERGPFVFDLFHRNWDKRSFPGGHAAHAMSCMAFWNERFDLGIAEPALYAVAAAVGWSRVVDGAHWPSDTFAGEAYGWAIGKGIADRYARREASRRPALVLQASVPF